MPLAFAGGVAKCLRYTQVCSQACGSQFRQDSGVTVRGSVTVTQSGVIKTGLGAVRGGEAEQPARVEWDGVASRWRASYPVTGGATSAQFSSWRFTTIASWVVRAMTTIASVSGSGFSSRCGTNGGTKM
jgi:hypothetical protein